MHVHGETPKSTHSNTSQMSSVPINALVDRHLLYLISRMHRARRARRAAPKPTQPQFQCSGPPFLAPHDFPTEIILHIADLLDEASLLALRHTNRDLFYIISLTPDQFSRASEARYLAKMARLTDGDNKDRLAFCTSCQELRPLTSFALSEVLALERLQEASCLQHTQLWICPHVGYDYKSIMQLPLERKGFGAIDERDGYPHCGRPRCKRDFRHRILDSGRWPFHYYIETTILISIVFHHRGGPGMLRDTIQRCFTGARVQKAVDDIRAPICDHHLLSDERVHQNYDPADIDLEDFAWHSAMVPMEHMRTVRISDGSCSFCQAAGVQTKFRFRAVAIKCFSDPAMASILLYAVVIRSLGSCDQKTPDQSDRHLRFNGLTERRLAKFRDAWTRIPSDVLPIFSASSDDSAADSQPPYLRQVIFPPTTILPPTTVLSSTTTLPPTTVLPSTTILPPTTVLPSTTFHQSIVPGTLLHLSPVFLIALLVGFLAVGLVLTGTLRESVVVLLKI
jgi:hypothetical protein